MEKKVPHYIIDSNSENKFIVIGQFASIALNNGWTKQELQSFIDKVIVKDFNDIILDIKEKMED